MSSMNISGMEFGGHRDILLLPQRSDSVEILQGKMTALANVVRNGQSLALATDYASSKIQGRHATEKAVAEMRIDEAEAWTIYYQGKYPLPKIDWNVNRAPAPTSAEPLRRARRRAEALNRLYRTSKAEPAHVVWLTQNELVHLPLVKAMARVIGAERNLLGGQCALSATQIADLQSINEVLSVSGQVLAETGCKAMSVEISSAQFILGAHRDMLRGELRTTRRKQKRAIAETQRKKLLLEERATPCAGFEQLSIYAFVWAYTQIRSCAYVSGLDQT